MKKEQVFRWMSHDPITVTPNTGMLDASNIMHKYDIRRLPVVDHNGKLVGIVTQGDIRECFAVRCNLTKHLGSQIPLDQSEG